MDRCVLMIGAALGLTAETVILTAGGYACLRSMGYTVAEAAAGAVLLMLMTVSLIHQISYLTGSPVLGIVLESIVLAIAAMAGGRHRGHLIAAWQAAIDLFRRETLASLTLTAAWLAMVGLTASQWVTPVDHGLLHIGEAAATPGAIDGHGALPAVGPIAVLNASALFFHTARCGLGPNACGFGVLMHMAIGCSTYALARRYAWPPMALTVTLMVLSMPRFAALGLRPSAELLSTAAMIYALVLIYRLIEQHRPADLRFLLLCLLFSIDANPMSIALVAVMLILIAVVMIRRHGWLLLRELVATGPLVSAMTLLPAIILAQIPVFTFNRLRGHALLGQPVAWGNEGLLGAAANLVRYLFATIDPTEPIRQMAAWLVGLDLHGLLEWIHRVLVAPVFIQAGGKPTFEPAFSGAGMMGFGPFAALLVLPAMCHAVLRGPRRVKALTVAWMGYLYVASLVVAWNPGNIATLSPLIAANGFLVAFWLPAWRLRRRGMRLLQADFALLLAWSLAVGAQGVG